MKTQNFLLILIAIFVINLTNTFSQSEDKRIELTPYLGSFNSVSTDYSNFYKRDFFNAMRFGFFSKSKITSDISFNFDAGGEINLSDITQSFPINAYYLKMGRGKIISKVGFFATPVTCFRPHPLTIESQAEYASQKQAPLGAYNLASSYNFSKEFSITGAFAERGNFISDSSEYSLSLKYKNSQACVCITDGSLGGALNLKFPEINLTFWAYYRENLLTNYTEIIIGKNSNLLFALDLIYDNEKGLTSLTQKKDLFGELVFLYLFDIPYSSKNNFSGGLGISFNRDCFNVILFTKIL